MGGLAIVGPFHSIHLLFVFCLFVFNDVMLTSAGAWLRFRAILV